MAPKYICGLQIIYSDNSEREPSDDVTDIRGKSNNISQGITGYDGGGVWLLPVYTDDTTFACVAFDVVVRGEPDSRYQSIAGSAGNAYRYLIHRLDDRDLYKITDVRLLRAKSKVEEPPDGYDGMSTDINHGRGGGYLYLIWKTASII